MSTPFGRNGHAPVPPSGLSLIVGCTASLQLQANPAIVPQPQTEEKAQGTAAHMVAMWAAMGRLPELGYEFTSEGRNWKVDIDMRNGARQYAEALGGFHSTLRLEDPVRCSVIHPTDCHGTPDAWRMFEFKEWAKLAGEILAAPFVARGFKNVVRVGDYKYGHRFVEVFECWQLIAYGVGVLERLQLSDETTLFEFILVQPRAYHREGPVRVWRVAARDLRALVNIAFNKAHEALGPNSVATVGEHCIDCEARHLCVTYKRSNANILDFSGNPELEPLDAEAMGNELRLIDQALARLEGRRTGLAIAVESVLRAGKRVPYFEMAPGRSTLKWKDDVSVEEIAQFGDLINVNLRKPPEVMTPTQAIAAGVAEEIIKGDYAHRPDAALKLQPISNKAVDKAFAGAGGK